MGAKFEQPNLRICDNTSRSLMEIANTVPDPKIIEFKNERNKHTTQY